MATPQQGVAYTFYLALIAADGSGIKVSPTLAAGDFKVLCDDVDLGNIATLPTEVGGATGVLKVALSATEMGSGGPATGSKVQVRWQDVAGDEWVGGQYFLDAPVSTLDALAAAVKNAIADAYLDRAAAADGYTPRQILRLSVAADSGKTDGMGTGTAHLRNAADTKDVVTATIDGSGNRTSVTRDLT